MYKDIINRRKNVKFDKEDFSRFMRDLAKQVENYKKNAMKNLKRMPFWTVTQIPNMKIAQSSLRSN